MWGSLPIHRFGRALPLRRLAAIGADPSDSDELRLRKESLVVATSTVAVLASAWVAAYLALGRPLAASIPLTFQIAAIVGLLQLARTHRYERFRRPILGLMLVLPFALQWALGGFINSSVVSLWSLLTALSALFFVGARRAVPWFAGFLGLLVLSALVDPALAARSSPIPETVRLLFFVLNVGFVSATLFVLMRYFVIEREHALAVSDDLLLNVLPASIAARLKRTPGTIAEAHPDVSVLFADVVDFTPYTERTDPHEVLALLDDIFSRFDVLAERHGVEKIKTIGDAYMVVAGAPTPRPDHVEVIATLAIEMLAEVATMCEDGRELSVRIGIDAGPVIAGVIGRHKFIYDLWGDAVNTAARMESHGLPGRIQTTARFAQRLGDAFSVERRGVIEVKGKGPLETWLVTSAAPVGTAAAAGN